MRTLILAAAMLTAAVPAYAQAPAAPKYSTSATTVGDLVKNPEAKAILEKHLPQLAQYFDQIGGTTLKAIQPQAQGAITDETLAKIDADLAKLK